MINIESLTISQLEDLRDACNRRLLQMRQTEGLTLTELLRLLEEVKQGLSDQGKTWRSLERWQWVDGKIRFWLNPQDQTRYRTGWYSIDDLIAWMHNLGPVILHENDAYEEALDDEWQPITGTSVAWFTNSVDDHDLSRVEVV